MIRVLVRLVWFQFLVTVSIGLLIKHQLRSSRRQLSSHLCSASYNSHHFHAGLLSYPENIFSVSSLDAHRSRAAYNCSYSYGRVEILTSHSRITFPSLSTSR
jgi:hypothetical protein